jgi:hypothetical protein
MLEGGRDGADKCRRLEEHSDPSPCDGVSWHTTRSKTFVMSLETNRKWLILLIVGPGHMIGLF